MSVGVGSGIIPSPLINALHTFSVNMTNASGGRRGAAAQRAPQGAPLCSRLAFSNEIPHK